MPINLNVIEWFQTAWDKTTNIAGDVDNSLSQSFIGPAYNPVRNQIGRVVGFEGSELSSFNITKGRWRLYFKNPSDDFLNMTEEQFIEDYDGATTHQITLHRTYLNRDGEGVAEITVHNNSITLLIVGGLVLSALGVITIMILDRAEQILVRPMFWIVIVVGGVLLLKNRKGIKVLWKSQS